MAEFARARDQGRLPIDTIVDGFVPCAVENTARSRTPLPEGYTYTDDISIKELLGILRHVGWERYSENNLRHIMYSWCLNGVDIVGVGVRDTSGELSGYGDLYYEGDNGQLCGLAVRPVDRGVGIGKAIVRERVEIAEELGVKSISIPALEETNTLPSYYEQMGFYQTEAGEFHRGPNPRPLLWVR